MHPQLKALLIASVTLCTFTPTASARSGGVAAELNLDRTGSPLTSGSCGVCHGGGAFAASMALRVLDAQNMPVTEYTPGATYTLQVDVDSTGAGLHGMQLVALDSANAQAGALSSPGLNSQITPLNGVQYFEHLGPPPMANNSFDFTAQWVAPASGGGDVTFYYAGVAANGTGGTSGDDPIAPGAATLTVALTCLDADMDGLCDVPIMADMGGDMGDLDMSEDMGGDMGVDMSDMSAEDMGSDMLLTDLGADMPLDQDMATMRADMNPRPEDMAQGVDLGSMPDMIDPGLGSGRDPMASVDEGELSGSRGCFASVTPLPGSSSSLGLAALALLALGGFVRRR